MNYALNNHCKNYRLKNGFRLRDIDPTKIKSLSAFEQHNNKSMNIFLLYVEHSKQVNLADTFFNELKEVLINE